MPLEVAETLPFLAAAWILETLVYMHRCASDSASFDTGAVLRVRGILIASFTLSACSHRNLQKVAGPVGKDPHKTSYALRLSLIQIRNPFLAGWGRVASSLK